MDNKWVNSVKKTDLATNELRNAIKRLFMGVLRKNGYTEIDLPTLDYSEAYIINNDYSSAQNHFKCVAPNGEVLSLGDDVIKGLISYSRSILNSKGKICAHLDGYSFLQNDAEGYQVGGIFFGADGLEEESDTIVMAYDFAKKLGVEKPRIRLGNTDVFQGVLNGFSGNTETLARLKAIVKGKIENEVDYATSQTLAPVKNAEGDASMIKDLAAKLDNKLSIDGLLDLFEVMNVLEAYGVAEDVLVAPGYMGEKEYDNGIVFRVETETGKPICYGGKSNCLKVSDRVKCLYITLCAESAVEIGKACGLQSALEEKRVIIAVAETRTALIKSRKVRKDLMKEDIMTDVRYNADEKTLYELVEKHRDRMVIYIDGEGNLTHS